MAAPRFLLKVTGGNPLVPLEILVEHEGVVIDRQDFEIEDARGYKRRAAVMSMQILEKLLRESCARTGAPPMSAATEQAWTLILR